MNKQMFVLITTILFLGVALAPSIASKMEQSSMPTLGGDIFYVGGSGEGNYSKIQDAIDNASDGDTVFVYDDSSPYYEHILINKSISLIGEDLDTTIIDGGRNGTIVRIASVDVNISNLTIQNGDAGISCGFLSGSNTLQNTIISDNNCGIYLEGSSYNVIKDNIISKNYIGIYLTDMQGPFGSVFRTTGNEISGNNFLYNIRNAKLYYLTLREVNTWRNNYWNRPRILPKFIFGFMWSYPLLVPWFEIDWKPAFRSYDI
jgi:parallel beta-helix repeat protein